MIDRETAIQWAIEAGCWPTLDHLGFDTTGEEIQALITRAQNEAFEQAAQLASDGDDQLMGDWHSERIRALKEQQ